MRQGGNVLSLIKDTGRKEVRRHWGVSRKESTTNQDCQRHRRWETKYYFSSKFVWRHHRKPTQAHGTPAGIRRPAYLPDFPVISAPGFLLQLLPGFHPLAIGKGNPVDPLQGFHSGVALPVCAGILNTKPHLTERVWHFDVSQISLNYVHTFPLRVLNRF